MKKNVKTNRKAELYSMLFALYLAILIYFLFFADGFRDTVADAYHYSFIPFREIGRYIKYAKTIGFARVFINLAGNIIAFMPFGFFVPHLSKRKLSFWTVTLLAMEFSVIVEVLQLFTKVGCCDIDDVILNTLGGMLGYACYVIGKGQKRR